MNDSVCIRFEVIRDECLQGWRSIGTGGFGQIYRAKHKTLGMDVAIKLLHYKDGPASSIQREALLMFQGGNPNVIRILGLYEGRVGEGRGLVMEFMPKGSVADLLQTLAGPPPWPLTFRMAHEISLGMNFLHHLTPPLLHLDLKPSNVLLDDSLRAKLTDFGLSRVARSVSRCSREKDEDDGGTLSYMPPEALQSVNYKASKATDVYSYGVLLWSIVTGKEPYEDALSSLVRFRIPQGDRPDLTSIDPRGVKGLEDMVKLMTECWHQDPSRRPSFLDCVHATEKISNMHKHGLNDAVYDVLKQLVQFTFVLLELPLFTKKPFCWLDIAQSSRYPTSASRWSWSFSSSVVTGLIKSGTESVTLVCLSAFLSGGAQITMSNVYGVQIGNNNSMNIVQKLRQRHRTAPSSVVYYPKLKLHNPNE
uniref:Receptor-interacting serine-threonine kinase 3 n=1 Tax=Sinocyclocheilus anshuiensis TaxID=1608454 RepID=A0A671PNC2_9TELE